MHNIRLQIAYEGTAYAGWQKTSSKPSIEGSLQSALETLLRHPIHLQAASRTDAGVHAQGQMVNFFTTCAISPAQLLYRLNRLLPSDIAVKTAQNMPLEFHATLHALKKEYEYTLCFHPLQLPFERKISWHFPRPCNLSALQEGARLLTGKADFSAFCNERALWDRSPLCTVESIEILCVGDRRIKIRFTGDHFLYKMVRNLAGTLAYVACGKLACADLPLILASQDRRRAGVTAPAHGLTLTQVHYIL